MSRTHVRTLKRHVATAPAEPVLAREAAVALLDRSIRFGHGRLAVVRLGLAAHLGAPITPAQLGYCQSAAERSRDPQLLALLGEVQRRTTIAAPTGKDSSIGTLQ
jgi:hypothetical protein